MVMGSAHSMRRFLLENISGAHLQAFMCVCVSCYAHLLIKIMNQVDFDSRAIVVAQGSSRTDLAEKPNVEILRRDRESHRHKQIWTKDAHGGPYRKVCVPMIVC